MSKPIVALKGMGPKTRSLLALGIVAIVATGGLMFTGCLSAGDPEGKKKEPPATGKRAEAFIAAFNKGDARAAASFWTPDATYVDELGHEYKGRAAIEQQYEKEFAEQKGAKISIHVDSRKVLSPDVVLEDGITEIAPADGSPPSQTRFSAVLVQKDGEWYLQSLRSAVARPPSNAEHLEDIEWLIGEWTGENEKGESARASYDWAENQNFIVSTFATTLNGVPVAGGTQWIGWDPTHKRIRSWSFYSGGGFGRAVWTKDGNKWVLKTTAKLADGKKASATNIITRTDDNHLSWQVTRLSVDGECLPDPKPVAMKRVQPAQP
jgi:uncharacterized protein (TIGR02246 family)